MTHKRIFVFTLLLFFSPLSQAQDAVTWPILLKGVAVAGDVRVDENATLVTPVIGTTPDNAVLLNRDGIALRQIPTRIFADDSNARMEGVVDFPITGDAGTPRATTRGLVVPGEPNPITLGDWRRAYAHGYMLIKPDGGSRVDLFFGGLVPNSLYGIWQFNIGAAGTDGPFGGIPNIFVTNERGEGWFSRTLPFVVTDVVDYLVAVYHSDHQVYGGVPSPVSAGFIHHGQVFIDIP